MVDELDVSKGDTVYAKPELVAAGDGTFYMVVNNTGLDSLVKTGLLTEAQQKRIYEEFGKEEKGKRIVEYTDKKPAEEIKQRLFVVQVEKDEKEKNKTIATRIFSGEYKEKENVWFKENSRGPAYIKHDGHVVNIDGTMNLISIGLPKQSYSPGTPFQLVMERATDKIIKENDISKEIGVDWRPTEKNAEAFKQVVDSMKQKLAIGVSADMMKSLAQANDRSHTPSTPEGYGAGAASATGMVATKSGHGQGA